MGPVNSIFVRTPAITDGGWGEGNDGSGNRESGNGISIGIEPLMNGQEPDTDGSNGDSVRIYPKGSGLIGRAEIVFVVPNACGDLPIYFESEGPLYPGIKGTKHSYFDPSSRILKLRTNEALSDDGLLEIKANTEYLSRDRYLLTISDIGAQEVLEEVELVKNAAVE